MTLYAMVHTNAWASLADRSHNMASALKNNLEIPLCDACTERSFGV